MFNTSLLLLIMRYLPLELWINHILPFIYKPQDKTLLRDIENYGESLKWIKAIYEKYHGLLDRDDWLINDLFGYLNDWQPTMCGYLPSFYQVWFRCYRFSQGMEGSYIKWCTSCLDDLDKEEELIEKYITWLETEPSDRQNRLFWGILTLEERLKFIRHRYAMFERLEDQIHIVY